MSGAHDHSNHGNREKRPAPGLSPEEWLELHRFLGLPPIVEVVAISKDTLLTAQRRVTSCESCDPNAMRLFSAVLDEVTNRFDRVTDYLLVEPAKCRNCGAPILETSLVTFDSTFERDSEILKDLDSSIETTNIVLVDEGILRQAEQWITACEHCSESAELSFDQLLDSLTGCDPTTTDYLMCREAKCGCCHRAVTEKTLVIPS